MRADNLRPNLKNLDKLLPEEKEATPENLETTKPEEVESSEKKDDIDILERRLQDFNFNDNNIKVDNNLNDANDKAENVLNETNIKVEEAEEDDLCQNLKEKLDLEDGEEDGEDRIARGPQKIKTCQFTSTPYLKTSPHRLHHSGGNVVDTTQQRSSTLTFDLFANTDTGLNEYATNLLGLPTYNFTHQQQQFIPELETCTAIDDSNFFEEKLDISEKNNFQKKIFSDIDIQILLNILEENGESSCTSSSDFSCSPPHFPSSDSGISSSPPRSNISASYHQDMSTFINSVGSSSGYESSPSTPSSSPGPSNVSNSPPNHCILSNFNLPLYSTGDNIPISVEEISSPTPSASSSSSGNYHRTKKYCPILPKPNLTYTMQEKFYKYIVAIENEPLIKRIIYMTDKIAMEKFTHPDKDGDTALIKLAANPNAIQLEGASLPRNSPAVRLAFVYAIVQRLERESPRTLNMHNNLHQSAVHLAATNAPEHPLFAAYIAESLQRHQFNLNQECQTKGCAATGGTLIHCLAALGDTHADVLRELLSLPGAYKVDQLNNNGLTPLQVAVEAVYKTDIKVHKTVEILIRNGAQLGVKTPTFPFSTPLLSALQPGASRSPDVDLLRVLLKPDQNQVNTCDARMHPLLAAAQLTKHRSCNADVVQVIMSLLVKHGAVVKHDGANMILNYFSNHNKQKISELLLPPQPRNHSL